MPSASRCATPGVSHAPASRPVRRRTQPTAPASNAREPARGSCSPCPSQPTSSVPASKDSKRVGEIGRGLDDERVEKRGALGGALVPREREPAGEARGERAGRVGSGRRRSGRDNRAERRRERCGELRGVDVREMQRERVGAARCGHVHEPRARGAGARPRERRGHLAHADRATARARQARAEANARPVARGLGESLCERGDDALAVVRVERVEHRAAEDRGRGVVERVRVEGGERPRNAHLHAPADGGPAARERAARRERGRAHREEGSPTEQARPRLRRPRRARRRRRPSAGTPRARAPRRARGCATRRARRRRRR